MARLSIIVGALGILLLLILVLVPTVDGVAESGPGHAGMAGKQYAAAVLKSNPVGYWRLSSPPDALGPGLAGMASNEIKGGPDGEYKPGVTLDGPPFFEGIATANFDGVSGYVEVPHDEALTFGTAPFSVEAIFKWNPGHSRDDGAFTLLHKGEPNGYLLRIGSAMGSDIPQWALPARVVFGTVDVPGQPVDTGSDVLELPFTDTEGWHHVVGTRDENGVGRLYLNGTLFSFGPFARNLDSSAPLRIGSSQGWRHHDGQITEVAIYGHALSYTEVLEHYWAATLPKFRLPKKSPGPGVAGVDSYDNAVLGSQAVDYWRLNDPAGSLVAFNEIRGRPSGVYAGPLEQGVAGPGGLVGTRFLGLGGSVAILPEGLPNFGTGPVSIEFLFRMDVDETFYFRYPIRKGDPPYGFAVWYKPNRERQLALALGHSFDVSFNDTQEWHHFVGTRDAQGSSHMYLDGVRVASRAPTAQNLDNDQPLILGGTWLGDLARVALYDRALGEAEIQGHYQRFLEMEETP